MAREVNHERRLWKGEVVTLIGPAGRGKSQIRDGFGFTHNVSNRDLKTLRDDDNRRSFRTVEDGNT